MIPALFDNDASAPLISNAVPPNFSESFRDAADQRAVFLGRGGLRSLVVTSTGPGEGKTLVATNLAVGLAQAGSACCSSTPTCASRACTWCSTSRRQPGLSNVLVGTAKFSEAVHATTVPGLWVMPAGAYPPNPSELLGSKRFKDSGRLARRAFRLGDHRHAAGHGGDRFVDRRAPGHRRAVRRRAPR